MLGSDAHFATIDVAARADMAAWLQDFDRVTPIDILVANAGILAGLEPGRHIEEAEASRHLMEINVLGVLNTVIYSCQYAGAAVGSHCHRLFGRRLSVPAVDAKLQR